MRPSAGGGPRRTPTWLGPAGVMVWLVVVWLALWGEVSLANLLSGVLAAAGLLIAFPLGSRPAPVHIRPLATARLAAAFAWALIVSTLEVALLVLRPGPAYQGVVAVPLRTRSSVVLFIVANITSLTPGTLTVDVDEPSATLFVHALTARETIDVRARVQRFEHLVRRAVGEER